MEPIRPIRSLVRGLDSLAVLNVRNGVTVSEVAQDVRLPRTTVYRILETLCDSGFVVRDEADERYRLTIRVRSLSNGFDDDAWIMQIVKPLIAELGRDIVWPVSVASLVGSALIVRESTDHETPLATERHSAGVRLPLLSTAAGHAFLAFCSAAQRDGLLDSLAESTTRAALSTAPRRAELERSLTEIRDKGYATVTRRHHLVDEVSMSVPVNLVELPPAVLSVRFLAAAVPATGATERFLPKLRRCAAKIASSFANRDLTERETCRS